MENIFDMIERLCPDGVEYKKLGIVTEMKRGTSATKKDLLKGLIPVISGGKEPAFYCDRSNRTGEIITVAGSGAGAGYVQYWNTPIFVNDAFSVKGNEKLLTKYIFYYLCNIQDKIYSTKKGGGVPHVHISSIENFLIPAPPIEIQREVVRILDVFTECIKLLEKELELRKKQYSYYRDKLLNFGDDVEYKTLGEIAYIKARIGWQNLKRSEYLKTGDYYLVTGVDISTNNRINFNSCYYVSKERYEMDSNIQLHNGDIIVTKDGTIGKVAIIENMDKPAVLNSHLFVIRDISGKLNNKFLMYILLSDLFKSFVDKKKTTGTISGLNQSVIIQFPVPIPPIEEQEKIVKILDKFDTLCNDLTTGIPAEISARKKQYEYYRDKIFDFKRR